eukprot:snap_masked-scaffold330_size203968-processed-gene-1.0 protein:Tk05067 transcript:snap_masked-scaffold330_size203968-processed-gene-1.0-mRNA-1 annotation:"adenosine kinase"
MGCQSCRSPLSYAPGGCALNSARMMAWLSKKQGQDVSVVFVGTKGRSDEHSDTLEDLIRADGVTTLFATKDDLPTGHCVNLVQSVERTMVANIGAASSFGLSDFQDLGLAERVKDAPVIYMEGFFAIHSMETLKEVCQISKTNGKLCFNLCGEYACRNFDFVREVTCLLSNIDILYGNRSEFHTFIKTGSSLEDPNLAALAKGLRSPQAIQSLTPSDLEPTSVCTVIITDGANAVTSITLDTQRHRILEISKVPVPHVPPEEIQDTVGAGDCFVAGYLFGILQGDSQEKCIETGTLQPCSSSSLGRSDHRIPFPKPFSLAVLRS